MTSVPRGRGYAAKATRSWKMKGRCSFRASGGSTARQHLGFALLASRAAGGKLSVVGSLHCQSRPRKVMHFQSLCKSQSGKQNPKDHRMDEQNAVHLYDGRVCSLRRRKEILTSTTTWINLEDIVK